MLKRVRSTVKKRLAYKQVSINCCLIKSDVKYDSRCVQRQNSECSTAKACK
jgi:hypothetical protein